MCLSWTGSTVAVESVSGTPSAMTMLEASDGDQRSYLGDWLRVIEERSQAATAELRQLYHVGGGGRS